jgi:hypothetical protein
MGYSSSPFTGFYQRAQCIFSQPVPVYRLLLHFQLCMEPKEVKMDDTQKFNRKINAIGWGLLLMLWGVTILFDFVPFGVGLLGTGLVLLGANGIRALSGQSLKDDNTVLGILGLTWGGLELARPILHQLFKSADLDWAIFAILLFVLGLILLARELLRIRRASVENPR